MITIRPATEQDFSLIRRLADEVFPATYTPLLPEGQVEYMMEMMYSEEALQEQLRGGHRFFLGYVGGEPAGYLSIEQQGNSLFHLHKLYVLPRFQRSCLGRALFKEAVREVRRAGALPARIELNVNRENKALGFYERIGMRRDRVVDIKIGEGFEMNDYIMVFDIN